MAYTKDLANDKAFFGKKNNGSKPRRPLRTFTETAADLGLTMAQLRYHMAHSDHNPPKPIFRSINNMTATNTYHDPSAMRAWWKRHNAESEQPAMAQ